jgi:hypothetical protein
MCSWFEEGHCLKQALSSPCINQANSKTNILATMVAKLYLLQSPLSLSASASLLKCRDNWCVYVTVASAVGFFRRGNCCTVSSCCHSEKLHIQGKHCTASRR